MKENTDIVMGWIGLSEGGYVNHPRDPGGETNRGITKRVWDAWLRSQGKAPRPVRSITKDEAEQILYDQYFKPVMFDRLPSGLDYAMVDYAVNSGPSRAIKELQRILGVSADGVMGNVTLGAVATRDPADLVITLCGRRLSFMKSLSTWSTFGKGWTRRVMGNVDGVQTNDIGVIDRGVRMAHKVDDIPAPIEDREGSIKADPEDRKQSSIISKAAQDPIALATGIGTAIAPFAQNEGPLQYAIAGAVLIGVAALAYKMVKRED